MSRAQRGAAGRALGRGAVVVIIGLAASWPLAHAHEVMTPPTLATPAVAAPGVRSAVPAPSVAPGSADPTAAAEPAPLAAAAAPSSRSDDASRALVARGRALYFGEEHRDAQLPDGSSMPPARAACVRCHRPSGLGNFEGRSSTPPIAGNYLFTALDPLTGRWFPWPGNLRVRPAYDEDGLHGLLTGGAAPDGYVVHAPMPRYAMSRDDTAALAAFLRELAVDTVPGVDETKMRFATITTPDVPAEQVAVMMQTLQRFAANVNSDPRGLQARRVASVRNHQLWYRTFRKWEIEHWALQGAPETWAEQLAAHYARAPVFAVLTGLSTDVWAPVHAFCEAKHVPCLFPQVLDVPHEDAPYNLYFDGGIGAQARAAIMHWRGQSAPAPDAALVVLGAADGNARIARLVEATRTALNEHGAAGSAARPAHGPWAAIALDAAAVAQAQAGPNPARAVYVPQFVAEQLDAAEGGAPAGSATRGTATGGRATAGSAARIWQLRAQVLPEDRGRTVTGVLSWLRSNGIAVTPRTEAVAINSLFVARLAMESQMHSDLAFSREYAIEKLEHTLENVPPLSTYPRLTLGPDQRIAAREIQVIEWHAASAAQL
jgi:hypothetical protein